MARIRDTDACPGALQVHQAADGALVRVRLPGGMITFAQLAALAGMSSGFGSGTLELTARGNVQMRAIRDVTAVADGIANAGLLPSATHERVRNIVASPLSGRSGGRADVRAWVGALDAAICAEPAQARTSTRPPERPDNGDATMLRTRSCVADGSKPALAMPSATAVTSVIARNCTLPRTVSSKVPDPKSVDRAATAASCAAVIIPPGSRTRTSAPSAA